MEETQPAIRETDPDRSRRQGRALPGPPHANPLPRRRTLETLQDVIVSLVLLLLLILSLRSIWRLGRMTLLEEASTSQLLSEIVLVLILAELYRLLIFYLSDHRISVALTIEVALVSTLRELMVKGAYEFEGLRLLGISLLLVVLGGLLALERWMGYWRNEARETDAR